MDPVLVKEVEALAKQCAMDEASARGDSAVQRAYTGATVFVTGAAGFLGKQLIEKLFSPAKKVETLTKQRAMDEASASGDPAVQRAYAGAAVFVTGATGFLGKQLIEKLFRSCHIKKVYILLRPKKQYSFEERLEKILLDPVFDTIKKRNPDFAQNIHPIKGDIIKKGLGLKEEDRKTIIEEVDIIIHGAATIRFDEPLRIAALTNIRGTQEMIELAKECKHIKAFIHLSTAYAHATKNRINQEVLEQFYDSPMSPKTIIEMAETMSDDEIAEATKEFIKKWPNTYTFTKAIGEEAVRQAADVLPVCVVRPAIVICSYQEPLPGWLDTTCAFGPSGFIVGIGLGVMHTLLANPDVKIDLVPVDLVNNAIIAAGWVTTQRWQEGQREPKIYTVTSMRNYVLWHILTSTLKDFQNRHPTNKAVWYSFVIETQYKPIFKLLSLVLHYIPAYIMDFGLLLAGKQQMAVKLFDKAAKFNAVLSFFTCNEWKSSDRNLQELFSKMASTDQLIYNCDMASVDWKRQIDVWAIGVRRYIVKDGLQDPEGARRKQYWFRIANYFVTALYFCLLLYLFRKVICIFMF